MCTYTTHHTIPCLFLLIVICYIYYYLNLFVATVFDILILFLFFLLLNESMRLCLLWARLCAFLYIVS